MKDSVIARWLPRFSAVGRGSERSLIRTVVAWLGAASVLSAAAANGGSAGDAIFEDVGPGLGRIVVNGGTFLFPSDGTVVLTNTLEITKDTVLDGGGHEVTLSGNQAHRLFSVHTNATLTLLNLRLTDGKAEGMTSAVEHDPGLNGYGGCVAVYGGAVTFSNCVLSSHLALGAAAEAPPFLGYAGGKAYGGAIYSSFGKVSLIQTRVEQSEAQGGQGSVVNPLQLGPGGTAYGGALYAEGGSVTLVGSRLSRNTAAGYANVIARPPGGGFGGALYVSNCTISISNSEFVGNLAIAPAGRSGSDQSGGGALFLARSPAEISHSSFVSNSVSVSSVTQSFPSGGGSIYSDGTLLMDRCEFRGNSVQGAAVRVGVADAGCGGALFSSGRTTLNRSTFIGNSALGDSVPGGIGGMGLGGAIYSSGDLTLLSCALVENQASGGSSETTGGGSGGALYLSSTAAATNTTFFGNSPCAIGASNATLVLVNATIAGNRAGDSQAGGIWSSQSTVRVLNIVLANPGGNVAGTVIDGGHNLSSDDTAGFTDSSSRNNADPLLGPLGDYGGDTLTLPLLANSPAIDAGSDAVAPRTDQRGRARPSGRVGDMGAFESSPPYTVRGQLNSFNTLTNVTVDLGAAGTRVVSSGPFALNDLAPGTYSVTPVLPSYLFDPASQSVTVGPDVVGLQIHAYRLEALNPEPLTKGTMRFMLAGTPGDVWSIQTSTNWLSWELFQGVRIPGSGLVPVSDAIVTKQPLKAYRGVRQ